MSRNYLTLFCILLVVGLAIASQVGRKCVNGKSYNNGCNNCWCTKTGDVACTLKGCLIIDPITGEYRRKPVRQPPEDFWEPQRLIIYRTVYGPVYGMN